MIVQIGVIATFVIYVRNFFQPMRAIAMLYNQLQSALAGAERIFTVLDAAPSVQDAPDAPPLPSVQGAVKFDRVSFEYLPANPSSSDVNLEVKPGQTIALVGPTGAGKTTIISLLSRFYDVTTRVHRDRWTWISAVFSRHQSANSWASCCRIHFLFSGTILDNIRYGRLDATEDEIIAAAKLANADRFIQLLPQGYQTIVSEQGHNFSHGQRQLLAIARAVLADPRILILDEATSSVDTRTEVYIQDAMLHLLEGRTAFVIAHRLSTIRNADLVLVINDHRIIEQGTHDELIALKGFYHHLYMSQFSRSQVKVS